MTRVAVLDDYQGRAAELADWTSLPGTEVDFFRRPLSTDEAIAALSPYDVLVLMRERMPLPRAILAQLPGLRLVVTTGMGNDLVDRDYLRAAGIPLCGTGVRRIGVGVSSAVEIAWALILATTKGVVREDQAIRAGQWQLAMPTTLAGATLGLAGLGKLGAEMVAPARAFGMTVMAWSQNLTAERAEQVGVERVSREDLLARSDVLSIHLKLSERSRGLFAAAEFAQMKRTAVLINTSRGAIVDQAALGRAVESGQLAGAGLDVYETEPLAPTDPVRSIEGIVALPHLGYVSEANLRVMYVDAVADIAAFLAGAPIRRLE